MRPTLETTGAECFSKALSDAEFQLLEQLGEETDPRQPGQRLKGNPASKLLTQNQSAMRDIAVQFLGPNARAVRAILFDKTADNNWPLGWHQDRTICVKRIADVAEFGPFTRKSGLLHVQPPASILEHMLTLRVHLDPCGAENAPLKVALGSHKLGLVRVDDIADAVASSEQLDCLAKPRDIWAYRTLILHASDAAQHPTRRRVLQVDFAAFDLPDPLEWAGI
ncbi:hypothetical protein ACFFUT_14065 [Pseudohalocynthiibacter aestuariivivens]|uniref:Phytanoyl-CoA dioxygenase family protein n=1 Tax=Pseudohalocynthiibacter aestuariivivens TaxID=1591409 RepID=A0ABV5JHP2_9RHOB|nr:hypothetical protein [Pseudohalocynthiibacter aestuariivivens]MBS9715384.1 hypothetical protein [Pseudohalocynthiibacter aestuariivivens]